MIKVLNVYEISMDIGVFAEAIPEVGYLIKEGFIKEGIISACLLYDDKNEEKIFSTLKCYKGKYSTCSFIEHIQREYCGAGYDISIEYGTNYIIAEFDEIIDDREKYLNDDMLLKIYNSNNTRNCFKYHINKSAKQVLKDKLLELINKVDNDSSMNIFK